MSVKIISVRNAFYFFALTLLLAGCTPSGPRALLKGKKYLDSGEYAAAVAQFKVATTLLATNAAAWNYYGVALQGAGQPDEAVNAYHRALDYDRDLLEARLNLGTLYLAQNQPDSAKTEFTAYTLRRPNDPDGWLKLGSAQLKLNETVPAERSFSAVLALKTSEAEAYNGLGLARIQRNRPREAAQFFAAAVQAQPDFAPAILNLATVNQQYLHDNKAALENFQKYLALTPRPDNWDEVNAIVATLERSPVVSEPVATTVAPVLTPAPAPKPVAPVVVAATKPAPVKVAAAPKPNLSPRAQAEAKPVAYTPPAAMPVQSVQSVQVAPEPQIVATPDTAPLLPASTFAAKGVTPLPGEATPTKKPVTIIPPAPVYFPRYNYLSPRVPAAGDRRGAVSAFNQARLDEQDQKWPDALANYRQAAGLDPSWFEAQYNASVLAQRQGEYSVALAGYEKALALKPDSVGTRYNFALTLKAAGYVPDAANELKKILATNPDETRAHLALANLCAQSLHDPAQARKHYLKVLELDPTNPRAADIRFWLAANP